MFYLKPCDHIHTYKYKYEVERLINNYNYYYYYGAPGAVGVRNKRFQQSASTHTGAGGKETLNIDFVGKKQAKVSTILNVCF